MWKTSRMHSDMLISLPFGYLFLLQTFWLVRTVRSLGLKRSCKGGDQMLKQDEPGNTGNCQLTLDVPVIRLL